MKLHICILNTQDFKMYETSSFTLDYKFLPEFTVVLNKKT